MKSYSWSAGEGLKTWSQQRVVDVLSHHRYHVGHDVGWDSQGLHCLISFKFGWLQVGWTDIAWGWQTKTVRLLCTVVVVAVL